MFEILIDTCVWFDLAKDYQQQAILSALEDLIKQEEISLILPRTMLNGKLSALRWTLGDERDMLNT